MQNDRENLEVETKGYIALILKSVCETLSSYQLKERSMRENCFHNPNVWTACSVACMYTRTRKPMLN